MPWLSLIISNVVLASLVAMAAWFVHRRLQWHALARVLWILALVKLATPPLVSVPVAQLPGTMACALGECSCGPHPGAPAFVRSMLPWILLAVWSAGAGAMLLAAWRRWTRFSRLLAHVSPAPPAWQALAARLADELSLRRSPQILAVPGALPPLVVAGRRRPCVLVPAALMLRLNRSQQEALLLHELVHIKRGDHLVRMLELAAAIAFWWLPIVGPIGRRLRDCEESCCDEAVVDRRPQARRDYARLLLDVIDFADPLPPRQAPQATAMSVADGLERRLRAILDVKRPTRRTWPVAALAMGLALVVLPCELNCNLAGDEFARQPTAAANRDTCEPAAKDLKWTGCEPPVSLSAYGCPS
jgi:beta-lactamase regulating signal transducer with metallopeptidase domain